MLIVLWLGLAGTVAAGAQAAPLEPPLPLPFTRPLLVQQPALEGRDVYVLQNLLRGLEPALNVTSAFDAATAEALKVFQSAMSPPGRAPTGVLDAETSAALLASSLVRDRWVWDRRPLPPRYKYLIHVVTWANRSRESNATLYDAALNVLLRFPARLHGVPAVPPQGHYCYSSGGGLNQFSTNGNTPSGLSEIDLNSPEDNATEYGPWPVNRVVRGLAGNARWLMTGRDDGSMIRSGILVHTGLWNQTCGWSPPERMPDSDGCVHVWPDNIYKIWQLLTRLGVLVRKNTYGALPYEYPCQGLLAVEQAD